MMKEISEPKIDPETGRVMEMNSIYMMSHSGARGSPQQMKQLAGMRGLMAQAVGRNHRDADPFQLQGRAHRARVLQLDARRAQGSGRHRAQDRELGLSHAPSRRRGERLHHHRRRLRHQAAASPCRPKSTAAQVVSSLAERILGRTTAEDVKHPDTGEIIVKRGKEIDRRHRREDRSRARPEGARAFGAVLRTAGRRLRQVLRARSGARHAGEYRRSGGRHRGAIDRRAGHAAHHAHLPHRRRGAGCRASRRSRRRYDGKIKIVNRNVVKNSDGELIAMGRNMQVAIVDAKGQERAALPHHLRRAAEGRRRRNGEARRPPRRMESERAAGPHRSRRHREIRRPRLGRLAEGSGRRKDRRVQQGRHRQPRHGLQGRRNCVRRIVDRRQEGQGRSSCRASAKRAMRCRSTPFFRSRTVRK